MKRNIIKAKHDSLLWKFSIIFGTGINVLLSFVATRFNLPVYLDAVGTIGVSLTGGMFPGIVTAVATTTLCALFDTNLIYFGCINVLIAMLSSWFTRHRSFKRATDVCAFILIVGIMSGSIGAAIQWWMMGDTGTTALSSLVTMLGVKGSENRLPVFFAVNILINIFDKGLSLGITLLVLHFIPVDIQKKIGNSRWRQNPLSVDRMNEPDDRSDHFGFSLKKRITVLLISMSFLLVAITGIVGLRVHFQNSINERKERAEYAAHFAAKIVDGNRIDEFIREGENAPGYSDIKDNLYDIRENAFDVRYLYIVKIDNNGSTYVFDLDDKEEYENYSNADDDLLGYEPGHFEPLEDSIKPYMYDILNGKEVTIETNDSWGWMATAYCPVRDDKGNVVCYAGADTTLDALVDYTGDFAVRIMLILFNFFVLIIAFGLNMSGIHITYPTNSMIYSIRDIINAGDDQAKLDEALRNLRKLEICTDDELEKLYNAFCDMASSQVEHIRSIRNYSEETATMQDGLIVTMADLVENRDSDTGAHIQKTAAYSKIIVEGLQKKGYYPEKISSKFISDVVRSAPLHDVGKISIPDEVLNKPGKLTDEEYEIIKTHTVYGKIIMEKAINTVNGENYLKEARNMAAYHHERWDGKGYPEGLHGEQIPLSARIMAVADVFDALTSSRVYKPPFPLKKALEMINENSGSQFDPKCVEVFMEALPEVEAVYEKYKEMV